MSEKELKKSKTSDANFSELLGQTIIKIENIDNKMLIFYINDDRQYLLSHDNECCESVSIEDITGNLDDLIDSPILLAIEEVITPNEGICPELNGEHGGVDQEEERWTFYKLATIKGYVDIRWYGCSNGYYSVGVNLKERKYGIYE